MDTTRDGHYGCRRADSEASFGAEMVYSYPRFLLVKSNRWMVNMACLVVAASTKGTKIHPFHGKGRDGDRLVWMFAPVPPFDHPVYHQVHILGSLVGGSMTQERETLA